MFMYQLSSALPALQLDDRFQVRGVREHIEGDDLSDLIAFAEHGQVLGERGGVAGDIDDLGDPASEQGLQHQIVQTAARRIDHQHIDALFLG